MLSRLLLILSLLLPLHAGWSEYKSFFIAQDGRVIDKMNGDVTHSESIGYAMYLALKHNDLATFDKIHKWYKDNLKTNTKGLISWKWGRAKDNRWRVLDTNNATDGDLWIAYDNLLMYERTKSERYKAEGLRLMQNIKKYLLIQEGSSLYLLPGIVGFDKKESIEINLSYYLFFIFEKFQEYDDDAIWERVKQDGVKLLYKARFSSLGLNPDWIKIDKKTDTIHLGRNHSFGYDAIRIPYNILHSKLREKKELLEPYRDYVNAMQQVHSVFGVTDLQKGDIALYDYSYGHLSIYNMIDRYFNKRESFKEKISAMKEKNRDDYYSYSIYLFTTAH